MKLPFIAWFVGGVVLPASAQLIIDIQQLSQVKIDYVKKPDIVPFAKHWVPQYSDVWVYEEGELEIAGTRYNSHGGALSISQAWYLGENGVTEGGARSFRGDVLYDILPGFRGTNPWTNTPPVDISDRSIPWIFAFVGKKTEKFGGIFFSDFKTEWNGSVTYGIKNVSTAPFIARFHFVTDDEFSFVWDVRVEGNETKTFWPTITEARRITGRRRIKIISQEFFTIYRPNF